VQSAEFFAGQYSSLLGSGNVEGLLGMIPDYIDFMKAYGGDYASFTGGVVEDLERLMEDIEDEQTKLLKDIATATGVTASGINMDTVDWLEKIWLKLDEQLAVLETGEVPQETGGTAGGSGLGAVGGLAAIGVSAGSTVTDLSGEQQQQLLSGSGINRMIMRVAGFDSGASWLDRLDDFWEDIRKGNAGSSWRGDDLKSHGWKLNWDDGVLTSADFFAAGGLARRPGIIGERGPEWAVPTYEPERGRFLADAGVEDALRRIMAENGGSGGEQHIHVHMDGREVCHVVADGMRGRNTELIRATRRATNGR